MDVYLESKRNYSIIDPKLMHIINKFLSLIFMIFLLHSLSSYFYQNDGVVGVCRCILKTQIAIGIGMNTY